MADYFKTKYDGTCEIEYLVWKIVNAYAYDESINGFEWRIFETIDIKK